MTQNHHSTDAWLSAELTADGPAAAEEARQLFTRLEYLTWPDRARQLDRFFWTRANEQLGQEEITMVINRQVLGQAQAKAVAAYVHHVKCVLTAALMELDERAVVESAWQGLTWLLSRRAHEHEAASTWLRSVDPGALRGHLSALPGFAFLILAATQDDSVESFLARDAFWDAMLGQTREHGGDHAGRFA